MSAAVYPGVPLALVATTAYNVGLILEKRALGQMPALDMRRMPRLVASLLTEPAWLTGFALMLTGLACQTVALTIAPVSVVQPLLSSGVALLLILSRLVLREQLGGGELCSVAAIAVAVVLLALSATGGGGDAGHTASSAWLAIVMIPSILAGLAIAASPLTASRRKHRMPVKGICYGFGTGLLYGVAALAIKAMSGVLTAHHALAVLVAGLLLSPYLYTLGACSAASLLLFQVALQNCRAAIVVPVSTVTSSMYFLIAGTWLFHEHLPASAGKLALRLGGILLTIVVLIVLARQEPQPRRQR